MNRVKNTLSLSWFLSRRCYGNSTGETALFTPNSGDYTYQEDRNADIDNIEAIPPRPTFSEDEVKRYHHEILSPENIADLVIDPGVKTLVTTILAKDCPFTGNESYKVTPLDPSVKPSPLRLYYSAIAREWIKQFRSLYTYRLKPLEAASTQLKYENQITSQIIDAKIMKYESQSGNLCLNSESLAQFFDGCNIHKELEPEDTKRGITFEAVSLHILNSEDVHQNSENLAVLLGFLSDRIDSFTYEGLKRFEECLVDLLYDSKVGIAKLKIGSVSKFISQADSLYENLSSSLSPISLEKLAYIYVLSSKVDMALKLLSTIVGKYRMIPKNETLDSFFSEYERSLLQEGKEERKAKVLRDLHVFKPIFFQEGLSSISFMLLIKNTITTNYDLEQFLSLCCKTSKGKGSLMKNLNEIFVKFAEINASENDMKSLSLLALVRRILIEEEIKIDEESKRVCEVFLSKYNQSSKVDIFQGLS